MTTAESQLASEADLERALVVLRNGVGDGRLSHSSFIRRLDLAFRARRRTELGELTGDLRSDGRLTRWLVDTVEAAARLRERVSSSWRGQRFPTLRLPEPMRYPLRIGRGPDCGLRLGSDTVSRAHAVLYYEDGRWFLRDLRSMNGTTVNGSRITTAEVRAGDYLGFGETVFRLIDR